MMRFELMSVIYQNKLPYYLILHNAKSCALPLGHTPIFIDILHVYYNMLFLKSQVFSVFYEYFFSHSWQTSVPSGISGFPHIKQILEDIPIVIGSFSVLTFDLKIKTFFILTSAPFLIYIITYFL